jgi:hypothetical protein
MISKCYGKKLAGAHPSGNAGSDKPAIVPDNTLCLHGPAKIVIGKDKHPIRYELFTSSICGLVPSLLILHGPASLLSEASRRRYVTLEICGAQFRALAFRRWAPNILTVEAARLFELVAHAARVA